MDGYRMKNIKTDILNDKLFKSRDFKEFIKNNEDHIRTDSFNHFLYDLILQSGLKNTEIFVRSGIGESYGYQLLNGNRQPSRDKIIQLAIGLKLSVEKTNQMLRLAEKGELYVKNKRDAVVMFSLINNYDLIDTNVLLEEENCTLFE